MALVMMFMLLSKGLGFMREVAMSATFGMNEVTDAYKTAFNIPCLLLSALISAVAAVFIPIFNEKHEKGVDAERGFVGSLFAAGLALSAIVALITFAALPSLTRLMLPNAPTQTIELTIKLSRIMMPMALFVFLYRLLTAYLQARFHFTTPAAATCVSAICIIIGIYVSNGDIVVVAIWTLIGMAMEFVTQVPTAISRGFNVRGKISLFDDGLRQVAFLMLPLLAMYVFDQLYIVFDRVAASANPGDISALDYGNRITTMVSAALLVTIATVLYPAMTRDAGERSAFAGHFSFGINLNIIIGLPAMVALFILATPITRLVYERGAFGGEQTAITAGVLACYAIGMIGVGVKELCNRAFWAQKSTKTPMVIGIVSVVVNIALEFPLYAMFGVSGVALASAISASLASLTLILLLRKRVQHVGGRDIITCLCKTVAATVIMSIVLLILTRVFGMVSSTGRSLIVHLGVAIAAGVVSYLAAHFLLRTKELRLLISRARTRGR